MVALEFTSGQQAVWQRMQAAGAVLQVAVFQTDGKFDPEAQGREALLEAFRLWAHPVQGEPGKPTPMRFEEWTSGVLRQALLDPPYSLVDSQPDDLWSSFRRHFISLPGPVLEVLSWGVHWSSYFEAGQEWWGSHCWTAHHRQLVTVMVASSTD